LEQVVLNLLDNALKHAPAGSAVTVAAAPEGSRWAVVHVRDRGPGIPAEALERVFDRFYRADAARDRGHGGSGLGLSIARALIEQHGGRIWVHSPRPGWDGLGPPGAEAGFALPTR
jgi:signal transduction histidine kinase